MSEKDNIPGARMYSGYFLRPSSPREMRREMRMLRFSEFAYLILIIIYAIATFVPALGQWRLWFGVTFHDALQALLYALVGAWLLRIFVPFYWHACRMPPIVWWQRAISLGVLLAVMGLGGAALSLLMYAQLGDALGFPLYVGGLSLSGVGVVLFMVGNIGLMRAILREQRATRAAQHQARVTPPAQ